MNKTFKQTAWSFASAKLRAIIAVTMIAIVFSMAACDDGTGPGGSGGGSSSSIGNLSGSTWKDTFGDILKFDDGYNYTWTAWGFYQCGGTYEVRGGKIYRTRTWGMELTNCETTLTIVNANTLRHPGGATLTRQ
jgi:hypothetical protein